MGYLLTCGVCKREADAIVETKNKIIDNMLNVCRRAFDGIAIIQIYQARIYRLTVCGLLLSVVCHIAKEY